MSANELAMNGGTKVRTKPYPARGLIGEEERAAVNALFDEAIASGNAPGYGGEQEEAFCAEFAELMGGGYADAVNSGTTAVHVALRALDLEPFSEVVAGCITDPGGMMPIALQNCIPVPADTAPDSFNPGPDQIEEAITPLTSAIVVPHIFGEPADMDGILAVAERYGLPVVEDCAQAHLATYKGQMVGTFGKTSAFSMMFGKHCCTGGQGGMVFTRDEALYPMIRRSADRGKPHGLPKGSTNQFASLNMNLSEFSSAIGREQLKKLPRIVARRQEVFRRITEGTRGLEGCFVPQPLPGAEFSLWKMRMGFRADRMSCDKGTFCSALRAEGMGPVMVSYRAAIPHTQDWFRNRRVFGASGYPWASPDYKGDRDRTFPCPNAMAATDTFFALLPNEAWTDEDIEDAITILRKVEKAFRQ